MAFNIVLLEPEIPANTGNIGRTCVATGTRLHLIEPLGFRLGEKELKRAGMDYWPQLDVATYINYEDFLRRNPGANPWMATTKAPRVYTEAAYEPDCYIMFGKESAGIPEELLLENQERAVRIPMVGGDAFPESVQFCGGRALRGPAAESVSGYEAGRTSDQIRLEVKTRSRLTEHGNSGCRSFCEYR